MGRSHGGLTTKIHAVVDAEGLPIKLKLTEGQASDSRSGADMLASIGPGDILLADRGYDSDALRIEMAARGAWANIRPMRHRKKKPAFSAFLYRPPMSIGHFGMQTLAARRSPMRGDHFGLCPGLVDEDEAGGIDAALQQAPPAPAAGDVRPILLGWQNTFF